MKSGSGSNTPDSAHEYGVLDEARIVVAIERGAETEVAAERCVERRAAATADAVALGDGEGGAAHRDGRVVELRLARNVPNGTAERAGAIQRALRAEQDLDALDVGNRQVDVQRHLADVRRDRVTARVAEELGGLDTRSG